MHAHWSIAVLRDLDLHVLLRIRSNLRIPGFFIYMCLCALKNKVYSNSCYSYSIRCK